ncbi:MAG: AmmeMemoRadiSam system radical SAM enzyme [Desulfobacterales bacterium]
MKREAMLYKKLKDNVIRCDLCAHHCRIEPEDYGFCGVRQNISGILYTHVFGETIARNVDPIEKKPLYHFLPGSAAFSIGTVGCNFRCQFCQNWRISQAGKKSGATLGQTLLPEDVVAAAKKQNCESIAYTYTEPTIFFEYAYETAKLAREEGIKNIFVTNGFMTTSALDTIAPYLDAANVDLKAWDNNYYKNYCEARLKPVLESIRYLRELSIWQEVTTLIIPGENDSEAQMKGIAEFIAGVDVDIPWHISAFHPAYEFGDRESTPIETLQKARKTGKQQGLRYVYLGNVPAENDTYCYHCKEKLVERHYGGVRKMRITDNKCPSCGTKIAGIWK